MELKVYRSMKARDLQQAWTQMETGCSPFCYYGYLCFIAQHVSRYTIDSVRIACVTIPYEGIVMIVPLKWNPFKHQYKMLGDLMGCGQTDALFAKNLSQIQRQECTEFFYEHIGHKCRLKRVAANSPLLNVPQHLSADVKTDRQCVSISIPLEEGHTLSKSVRQNIRTAYNRIDRNHIHLEFRIYNGEHEKIDRPTWKKITDIYIHRLVTKYKRKARKHKLFRYVYAWRYRYIEHDTHSLLKLQNTFHAILFNDDDVMAFLSGFMSHDGMTLVIPRLSINETYRNYSPGYILLTELQHHLENNTTCQKIDLCRGNEQYKTDLGGTFYYTYQINFSPKQTN